MVLDEIMKALEGRGHPLTVSELAATVGVEKSALSGMLGFLERKGKLVVYRPDSCAEQGSAVCTDCVFTGSCPIVREEKK
jgi:predicted Zn-ribbon and HTH transcriptional regulator